MTLSSLFDQYAFHYLLIPTQILTPQDVLAQTNLPPLPPTLSPLIDLNQHQLASKAVVIDPQHRCIRQWNPYSGSFPLECTLPLSQGLDHHRWILNSFEARMRCLYDGLHEWTHQVLASLGLMGLLRPHLEELTAFHTLSEALAVLVGDLYAHNELIESGYIDQFWPPHIQKSHALHLNPVHALKAAHIDEFDHWIFNLYLNPHHHDPYHQQYQSILSTGDQASYCAFLLEELKYAHKIKEIVAPAWNQNYWSRPEIQAYLKRFVPPASLKFPHLKSPISSNQDLITMWKPLLFGWNALSPKYTAYISTRLQVQRTALKVSELLSVFNSVRLKLDWTLCVEIQNQLHRLLDRLYARFIKFFALPIDSLNEKDALEIQDECKHSLMDLIQSLKHQCGDILWIEHPFLDRLPMSESDPILINRLETRSEAELRSILDSIHDEALDCFRHAHGSQSNVSEVHLKNLAEISRQSIYFKTELDLAHPYLSSTQSICTQIDTWLQSLLVHRDFVLPYPLDWADQYPFVDPLIGFRFQ